jgi:hypothetical protein
MGGIMPTDGHSAAVRDYQGAIDQLYGAPHEQRLAAAASEEAPTPQPDEARVGAVLDASRALTGSTTAMLADDDPNVRASAQARLAALAATDIAVALDVAQLEEDARPAIASSQTPTSSLSAIEPEVRFVLAGDPAKGVPVAPDAHLGGATLASTSTDPRGALRASLPESLGQVRDDAIDIVVDGLGRAVGKDLGDVLGGLGAGLLQHLPSKVGRWYRWALDLLKEGISKLQGLLGDGFERALETTRKWLAQHAPTAVANRVYDVPGLGSGLQRLVDGVSAEAADNKDWAQIEEEIRAVVEKFRSIKKVVLAVFKVLAWARTWILHAITGAAGPLVVGGAFVLGGLFGLFAGGDYIDWKVTEDEGAFDFVRGVRRTAEAELA